VGAAHSVAVLVFLVLQPDIIVDEEPNADAATDRVAGCCVEHRRSGTWEEDYPMGLS
jgi:hypothetical protein